MSPTWTVVVPTVGRSSLATLLRSLAGSGAARPAGVVVVDDRPASSPGLPDLPDPGAPLTVLRSWGRGPAAARNAGWAAARSDWVVFVDDDVELTPTWCDDLVADLSVPPEVAGVPGRVVVPLPQDRRPTDWERGTARLAEASWITADMAYRRRVLVAVGGFDERFPRAFREDADLALRVLDAGWRLVRGSRVVRHPVRPAGPWVSVRQQAGNADDVLMQRLHGAGWRERAQAPRGRWPRHVAVTAAGLGALLATLARRRTLGAVLLAGWGVGTAELAWRRIAPGPRDPAEVARMVATSLLIPPVATAHRTRGLWVHRRARRLGPAGRPRAVFFDRDGTLVRDVPYNRDPDAVQVLPGAKDAVERVRAAGLATGVLTNQSGVGRGLLTDADVAAVNSRVDALLGPFDVWVVCPHGPDEGCSCRKPAPGLVRGAARRLGLDPSEVVVIGDIGADVEAATRAGARGVLVPTSATRPEEVSEAPIVAADLAEALDAAGVPA
jgi:HAD superfamily hydrolase (TIGR01662 family)